MILLAQSTSIFDPASPPAEAIRSLSVLVLAITGFIFIAVEGILIYSIIRFRRRAAAGSLDELRALAQNFTAQSQAIFVATLAHPPSVLLATSADAGVDAGQKLKAALADVGGRGGGTPRMAQGSVPDSALLEKVVEKL